MAGSIPGKHGFTPEQHFAPRAGEAITKHGLWPAELWHPSVERQRRLKILVTGSSGLIGSEAVLHFDGQGHEVVGVDNNMRRLFFGDAGDTLWNLERLKSA